MFYIWIVFNWMRTARKIILLIYLLDRHSRIYHAGRIIWVHDRISGDGSGTPFPRWQRCRKKKTVPLILGLLPVGWLTAASILTWGCLEGAMLGLTIRCYPLDSSCGIYGLCLHAYLTAHYPSAPWSAFSHPVCSTNSDLEMNVGQQLEICRHYTFGFPHANKGDLPLHLRG